MFFKRLFITVLLFFTSYQLFSEELILSDIEKLWLKEHPVIRLGVGTNYPPIQYVTEKDGEYEFSGIASDYLEIISALLGIEFKIKYGITFKEALEMGKNKELDLFPCLAYTEEREEFLEFTEGYLENPLVIFANEDAPFIGSIQDLSGLRVADVEALYNYKKLKTDVPGIEFVLTGNAETSLERVALGQADANVAGLISGSYLIRKNNWTNIKIAAPTPYSNTLFRMAVRNDWPELASILDKALHSIDQDRRNEIKRRWLAVRYEYGIDQRTVAKQLSLVGGISIIVLVLSLFWINRLRREIKQRKKVEQSLGDREIQLREMVEEKELLIREVYHRVKNNLSLVVGLVNLQAADLSDQEDANKMEMVIQRINSIILLNEKLSQASDMKNIDISDYVTELIAGIELMRSGSHPDVEIRYTTVKASFDGKMIIPIGLIITELVTNALKYGFDENSQGLIEISLEKKPDDNFLLIVKNNGSPIPDEIDLENPKTLGLMLVSSLSGQLNGIFHLTRAPSPEFALSFPYSVLKHSD